MHLMQRLMFFLRTQDTEDFIESMIRCFAAPLISGLKCGSLLNLSRKKEDLPCVWRSIRGDLMKRLSLEAVEISQTQHSVLIFLYRQDLLLKTIASPKARAFLTEHGYADRFSSVEPHLDRLVERFRFGVPHEVGIFLGYPVEDVAGFIENGGKDSKLSGYWKVYGDEIEALKTFRAYRRAEMMSAWNLLKQAEISSNIPLAEHLPAV